MVAVEEIFHKAYALLKPLEKSRISKYLEENKLMRTLQFIDLKILDKEYILVLFTLWSLLFLMFLILYIVNYLFQFFNIIYLIAYSQLFLASLIIVLYYLPFYFSKKKIYEIKKEFTFFLSHFKILANSNLNFNEIFSFFISNYSNIYPTIQKELFLIYKNSKVFNKSIESSLKERMKIHPKNELKNFLLSLINIKREKKSIKDFVNSYYNLENKKLVTEEKKFFQKMSLFSEIYLMILLILPFFFVIISIIFDSINFSLGEFGTFNSSNFYKITIILLLTLPLAYTFIYSLLFKIMPPHLKKLSENK